MISLGAVGKHESQGSCIQFGLFTHSATGQGPEAVPPGLPSDRRLARGLESLESIELILGGGFVQSVMSSQCKGFLG